MKLLQITGYILYFLVAGCAMMSVGSDYDPELDLSSYNSYAWETMDTPLPTGDPRLDDNPFFDDRVRAAVDRELAGKGFEAAGGTNADLILHYHMFIEHRERVDIQRVDRDLDVARGYSIFETPLEARAYPYDEGTLMIDIADAGNKRIIWRGWARLDVTTVLDDRDRLDQRIQEAVRKIINRVPAG
jgi:hypothetical protein